MVVVAVSAGIAAVVVAADPGAALRLALRAIAVVSRALLRFVGGALVGLRTPHSREAPGARLAELSGTEFEDHIARSARAAGVPVIMTPMTGDWGVDLILGNRPNRVAVQCKRLSRPVGPGAVQEVVAGASMQECTRAMVVSNQEFTPAARRLAEHHRCTLVGGSDLPRLRRIIAQVTFGPEPDDRRTG